MFCYIYQMKVCKETKQTVTEELNTQSCSDHIRHYVPILAYYLSSNLILSYVHNKAGGV
jgi:hypothetical protein